MQNHTQSESLKVRSPVAEPVRPHAQPRVVMATIGAEDVDANGAPCERASGHSAAPRTR